MKAILPDLDRDSSKPMYLQLFEYIRDMILHHDIAPGEKLPSLRRLSEGLQTSPTTIEQAYDQLLVEGYIESRPRKGFFVSSLYLPDKQGSEPGRQRLPEMPAGGNRREMLCDLQSFDFIKWKKCLTKILNESPEALLFESDPQGEEALRREISKYVYTSRGVRCTPERVVIAAGTQQITSHLATILRRMGIENVALEDPGYAPVRSMLRDRGFAITKVPVGSDGIEIERLPMNIRSAAYVAPQNQFPTGAVMPVSRRYELLDWAAGNDSYIIEDDYDSELRYFGKPVPALQGIDENDRVVYLGSFSSTLIASLKISYMILPPEMEEIFAGMREGYTQTCSKTEQLALALFMENGYYGTGIRKLRRLCAQKLKAALAALEPFPWITPHDTNSGTGLIIDLDGRSLPEGKTPEGLVSDAAALGISVSVIDPGAGPRLLLDYTRIPLKYIPDRIEKLAEKWYHPTEENAGG